MYHLHVKNLSRRDGRSAVASAAYRAGETLPNEQEEAESAFGGRRDVRYAEIRLPEGAPAWMGERAALWNAVEAAEKRVDARLAKEIEFALPRALPRQTWLEVTREMADAYTARGHVVDLAIHDDDTAHNPHAHLMLTTRAIAGDGFGPKIREADGLAFVRDARARWERIANAALAKVGSAVTVDARSYAARGIAKTPGQHRGPDPKARREKRREAQRMSGPVQHDILEARRELLADHRTVERFPFLTARADWPPESREAPSGLTLPEREEFRAFWREVDKRVFEPDQVVEPAREPDEARSEAVEVGAEREPTLRQLEAAIASVRRDTMPDLGREALRQFADMQERVNRAFAAHGITVENNIDVAELNARLQEFRRTLLDIRLRELRAIDRDHQDERNLPVPGPHRDPVSQGEQEQAQDRMLDEMHGPAPRAPDVDTGERRAAEDSVLRQAQIDVSDRDALAYRLAPQEDRLDWLQDRAPVEPAVALERDSTDDRLDWLRQQPEPQRESEEIDRDRQRR